MNADPRELLIRHNPDANRFEAEVGGEMGVIEYRITDGNLVLYHTFVPEAFRGKRIAQKLVAAALEFARRDNLKVVPECDYVAAFLGRHPEFDDLKAG